MIEANSKPLVSVILPVYNGSRFLKQAIRSIVNQTLRDLEIIIIDDGSTDSSLRIIREFAAEDQRIRVVSRQNRGLVASLNQGIRLARGEWIARMDADDVSHPKRLARQLEVIQQQPEASLVASKVLAIDEHDKLLGVLPVALSHAEICARPWSGFYMAHPSWFGRTEWFRKYMYAEPGHYRCEDQELLLRAYADSEFRTADEYLLAYRIRPHRPLLPLLKTRLAFLKAQLQHFSRQRQFLNFSKCVAAAIVKILNDLLRWSAFRTNSNIVETGFGLGDDQTEWWR